MAKKQETTADVIAAMRDEGHTGESSCLEWVGAKMRYYADRFEAAQRRERRLLKSCARWIFCHDIYGHMAKELLAECKEVLNDDGQFLFEEDKQ